MGFKFGDCSFLLSFVLAIGGCGDPADRMPDALGESKDWRLCSKDVPGRQLSTMALWSHIGGDNPSSAPFEDTAWVAYLPAGLIGTQARVVDITAQLTKQPEFLVHDTDGKPVLRWACTVTDLSGQSHPFTVSEQPAKVSNTRVAGIWKFLPEAPIKIGIENYNKQAAFMINFSCD